MIYNNDNGGLEPPLSVYGLTATVFSKSANRHGERDKAPHFETLR